MNKVIKLLENIKTRVAQVDPALAGRIDDAIMPEDPMEPMEPMESEEPMFNPMINTTETPKIESFARG